jgi:hypothetical protein
MKKIFLIGLLILLTSCTLGKSTPQIAPTPTSGATLIPTSTFTPAPTLPPTPTLTPTSVPIFFTEEFNADLGAWSSFQTGGAQPSVVTLANDSLNIQMNAPHTWYYAIHNAHEYPGVFLSAKFSGAPAGSMGLVCNYSEAYGWYEFNITHEGTFSVLLGKWLAPEVADYTPIFNGSTEYIQVGNLNYEIGLTCHNNTLFLQVNGKMFRKLDVSQFGLPQGKIGISAASFDNVPMNANFEWFKVSPPEW